MRLATLSMLTSVLLLAAANAHAAGTNLSWDDCGASGAANKTFACDVNSGTSFVAIASFVAPEGTTAITGMEAVIDLATEVSAMPSWWQFFNADACRRTSLTVTADFANYPYSACTDFWEAQLTGGIWNYVRSYNGALCRSRLLVAFARPQELAAPLEPEVEYYALRLAISRDQSVGNFSCAGCLVPVSILLTDLKLTQPAGVGDYRVQNPADRNWITWQNSNPYSTCLFVPTRNSTWGAIKAQYR